MRTYRDAVISAVFILLAAAAGCYIVAATVRQLAPAANPSAAVFSLWRLVLLSLGGGTIAFTIVEFVKRESPLRSWFNKRTVSSWFGSDRTYSIYYPGNIRQICAQISQELRQRGRPRSAAEPSYGPLPSGPGDPFYDLEERRFTEELEQRIDAFQIAATAQWHYLLRTMAAVISGALSLFSALAAHARLTVWIGALLFGTIVGGPFSWVIRDLARAIERRAGF